VILWTPEFILHPSAFILQEPPMTQQTKNFLDLCFIILIVAAFAFCLLLAAGCSMFSAVPDDVRQNADLVAAMTRQDYEQAMRSNASLQRLERERNKRDAAENVRAVVGSEQPLHLADSLALDDARRPAAVDAGTQAALDPLNTAIREQGDKINQTLKAVGDAAGKIEVLDKALGAVSGAMNPLGAAINELKARPATDSGSAFPTIPITGNKTVDTLITIGGGYLGSKCSAVGASAVVRRGRRFMGNPPAGETTKSGGA